MSDEWETPGWVWEAVAPLVARQPLWEPFPGISKRSTQAWKTLDFDVLETTDFFNTKWPADRILVSNPPWSRKFDVLKRCFESGHPFLLLLPSWVLASKTFATLAKHHPVLCVVMGKRVHYYDTGGVQRRKTGFDSVFLGVLPNHTGLLYL